MLLLHVLLLFTMGAHIVNDVVEGAVAVNARRAAAFYADVCFSYLRSFTRNVALHAVASGPVAAE